MNPSFEIAPFNYSGLVFNLVLKGKSISNELIFEHHGEQCFQAYLCHPIQAGIHLAGCRA